MTYPSRPCARPGCARPARPCLWASAKLARYCETCRAHARKHGDPMQSSIRRPDVTKTVKRITRLLKRGDFEKIEQYLRDRATLLREAVESPEAVEVPTAQPGRPRIWVTAWKLQTVSEMKKVLDDTDPVASGLWIAAVFLVRIERPNLFASDDGFNYELFRLWRAQTRTAFGSFYNHEKDRVTFVYKTLPPRVTEYGAEFLKATYARFAGHVQAAVEKERAWRAESDATLREGFASLRLAAPLRRPIRPCASPTCFGGMTRRPNAKYCSLSCAARENQRLRALKKSK